PEQCRRSLEESLVRLGTDHVDLYFAHTPLPSELFDVGSLDVLDELKAEGLVRCRGFSLGAVEEDLRLIEPWIREGRLDCVQVTVNLLQQGARERLLGLCVEYGLGVVARESLARGFLGGAMGPGTTFPQSDFRSRLPQAEIEARLGWADRYAFLAD